MNEDYKGFKAIGATVKELYGIKLGTGSNRSGVQELYKHMNWQLTKAHF